MHSAVSEKSSIYKENEMFRCKGLICVGSIDGYQWTERSIVVDGCMGWVFIMADPLHHVSLVTHVINTMLDV